MSTVAMRVRQANVISRPRLRLGLLLPAFGLAVLLVMPPFGGLAAVITTAPAVMVLILLYLPVVAAMARREAEVKVARAIWIGFGLKLIGFVLRYLVISGVYGAGDSTGYHRAAATLARAYRQGDFSVPVPGDARGPGTLNLRVILGLIYTVTGSSLLVGALVFSLLSFTGLVLCVKAFRLAVPNGDHVRYARLVLLLPSMLFWPSTIGKDAWMLMGIGFVVYGAARLYTRSFGGLAFVAIGSIALTLIRPHIALVTFGAAAAALVFRRAGYARRQRMNLVGKLLLLIPLGFASLMLLTGAQTFLRVDDLSLDGVEAAGAKVGERSDKGGSAFTPVPVASPVDLPLAFVTVLFRPSPIEASNTLSFGIALEGTYLLLFTVVAWRRILAGLRSLPRSPFLVLCGLYTLAFVIAFSNIANFGILARQRVQVFPFFFAFLAAVPSLAARRESVSELDDRSTPPTSPTNLPAGRARARA